MEDICKKFYTNLLALHVGVSVSQIHATETASSPCADQRSTECILTNEEWKTPGHNGIYTEPVKASGHGFWRALAVWLSWYLAENIDPSNLKESKAVLPNKKGGKEDVKEYRPSHTLMFHI